MPHLTFSEALKAAHGGDLVARYAWQGKDVFVFVRPGIDYTLDRIVNKDKSFPVKMKEYYASQLMALPTVEEYDRRKNETLHLEPFVCLKAVDNTIINGWFPSQSDMLANDWYIL